MPSNKIYTVLVLCLGIIISIWLLVREPKTESVVKNTGTVSAQNTSGQNTDVSDDWQSILENIDFADQNVTSIVPKNSEETFNDTTLTAQMAKDFFARYLSVANGEEVGSEDAVTIADSILASPEYTKATGAVYLASNLRINPKTDKATTQTYFDTLTKTMRDTVPQNNDDPMAIVGKAVQNNNENELKKLDTPITTARVLIQKLLSMEVPVDAVQVHLGLLNTGSNLLSNMEAMRVTFADPIRGFVGASQYTQHLLDFLNAVNQTSLYFKAKLLIQH